MKKYILVVLLTIASIAHAQEIIGYEKVFLNRKITPSEITSIKEVKPNYVSNHVIDTLASAYNVGIQIRCLIKHESSKLELFSFSFLPIIKITKNVTAVSIGPDQGGPKLGLLEKTLHSDEAKREIVPVWAIILAIILPLIFGFVLLLLGKSPAVYIFGNVFLIVSVMVCILSIIMWWAGFYLCLYLLKEKKVKEFG